MLELRVLEDSMAFEVWAGRESVGSVGPFSGAPGYGEQAGRGNR